jgi:hypothetical protein
MSSGGDKSNECLLSPASRPVTTVAFLQPSRAPHELLDVNRCRTSERLPGLSPGFSRLNQPTR